MKEKSREGFFFIKEWSRAVLPTATKKVERGFVGVRAWLRVSVYTFFS